MVLMDLEWQSDRQTIKTLMVLKIKAESSMNKKKCNNAKIVKLLVTLKTTMCTK